MIMILFQVSETFKFMNVLLSTQNHKATSVGWYTNVTQDKGIFPSDTCNWSKYCALQECIIKMKMSSILGAWPRNQDNKGKEKDS